MIDGVLIVARDAGQIVGTARVTTQDLEGRNDVAQVGVAVLPGHRRRGIGRMLLQRVADATDRFDRPLLIGSSRENVPSGEAFSRRIGAELAQVVTENRLDLHELDRDLIDSWLDDGPRRAPGYSTKLIQGQTPEAMLPAAARAFELMNTAPMDDLQMGDFKITPEQMREHDLALTAAGFERWACYAVLDSTGELVGFTDITFNPKAPEQVQIGNTVVDPAHRGHGLGKWIKAAMLKQVLAELPQARWMVTGNAASNDAMLAINRQLGFRASAAVQTWQVTRDRLREYLAGSAPP
jgi:GNAT superfamily N-acetyltransferase